MSAFFLYLDAESWHVHDLETGVVEREPDICGRFPYLPTETFTASRVLVRDGKAITYTPAPPHEKRRPTPSQAERPPRKPVRENAPKPPKVQREPRKPREEMRRKSLGLGDAVEKALEYVGITAERVQKIIPNCACKARKEMLNRLGAWAMRAVGLGKDDAEREFEEIGK